MSLFDVNALLDECSPDAPSGSDLEYDDAFSQMERAAQGKPEQQYGDTVIDAEPPDWKEVKSYAIDVVSRSKDIRAAVHLAKAALFDDGLPAFRDVLALVHGYLDRYWATFHPQLDPDDDNDPTIRANTLNGLCEFSVLEALREATVAKSRGFGPICYRQISWAKGETNRPEGNEEEILGLSTVESIFADADHEEVQEVATALSESLEHAKAIDASMTEHVGAYDSCNLETLVKELTHINSFVQSQLAKHAPQGAPAESHVEPASATANQPASNGPTTGAPAPARPGFNGEIHSREDAIRAIDCVCQYFERHEPSSPLPLLLRRAKRLSTKSFLEILKDVSPDGVSQAEALGGAGGLFEDYATPAEETRGDAPPATPQSPSPPPTQPTNDGY